MGAASAAGTTAIALPDSAVTGGGFPWCRVVNGTSRLCAVEAAEFALCYAGAGTSTVTKAGTIVVRAAPQALKFSTTPASTAIQVAAATVASLPSDFATSLSAALVAAPEVPTARSPFVLRVEGAGLAANDRLKIIDAPGSCAGSDTGSSPALFQHVPLGVAPDGRTAAHIVALSSAGDFVVCLAAAAEPGGYGNSGPWQHVGGAAAVLHVARASVTALSVVGAATAAAVPASTTPGFSFPSAGVAVSRTATEVKITGTGLSTSDRLAFVEATGAAGAACPSTDSAVAAAAAAGSAVFALRTGASGTTTASYSVTLVRHGIWMGCYRFEHEGWESAGKINVQRSPEVTAGQSFKIVAGSLSRIVVAGFALRSTDTIQLLDASPSVGGLACGSD